MIAKIENGGSRRRVYRHAHRPGRSRAPGYLAVAILVLLAILAATPPPVYDCARIVAGLIVDATDGSGTLGDDLREMSVSDHALCDY